MRSWAPPVLMGESYKLLCLEKRIKLTPEEKTTQQLHRKKVSPEFGFPKWDSNVDGEIFTKWAG